MPAHATMGPISGQCTLEGSPLRIGILSDIHEAVEPLERALVALRELGAERIVVLGDLLDMGERIDAVVRLLTSAGATGVWGNHDFGLCRNPPERASDLFPAAVLEFFRRLSPRLVIGDCLFTHVSPCVDPERIEELWSPESFVGSPESIQRSFAAVPHRILCLGHAHRWLLATPEGIQDWTGAGPVALSREGRVLLGIHAVLWGRCALLDTDASQLVPIDVGRSGTGWRGFAAPAGVED